MARSILTPLQLTAAASLLNNQGLKSLPAALTSAIAAFNATGVISALNAAVASYLSKTFVSDSVLFDLLSIGNSTCPALGNSIPVTPLGDFSNLVYPTTQSGNVVVRALPRSPYGFSGLIEQTGNAYLGDGDNGKFAQGFMAVQGFITLTNDYINTASNANQYLGPTFKNINDLTSFDVVGVNSDVVRFGIDLQNQGNLWDMGNLELYGTPAGLLQQISAQANINESSTPGLVNAMQAVGMSKRDIADLVSDNRQSLFNPTGLTANQFDRLQKSAYLAMNLVSVDDVDQVLRILDVKTSNLDSLTDLFDPIKTFPLSYKCLTTPSPDGPIKIYTPDGSVNQLVQPVVNSYLPTQSGCDELGKIIPPVNAVANKAVQVALSQISGIADTTLPELADAVRAVPKRVWNPNTRYNANDLVSDGAEIPTAYRAQDDVPPGANLSDTDFWEPTAICAVSTMEGLPDIESLATPAPSAAVDFFENVIATGNGPSGTITICDVLGTAVDYNDVSSLLARCTEIITLLDTAGALTALKTTYNNIASAANDAAVAGFITTANTDIGNVIAAYPDETTELNEKFVSIAESLNRERGLQTRAGIDYFELIAGEQTSIMSFVQNLSEYAQLTAACQAAQFLDNIADTSEIGGQAIVGAMREARNTDCLESAGLFGANQIPADPVVAPTSAVLPVPNEGRDCP
jgi:hypothetical protein